MILKEQNGTCWLFFYGKALDESNALVISVVQK
jgi:hypothetical protein